MEEGGEDETPRNAQVNTHFMPDRLPALIKTHTPRV